MNWNELAKYRADAQATKELTELIEDIRKDPDTLISVYRRWMLLRYEHRLPDDVLVICHLRGLLNEL